MQGTRKTNFDIQEFSCFS